MQPVGRVGVEQAVPVAGAIGGLVAVPQLVSSRPPFLPAFLRWDHVRVTVVNPGFPRLVLDKQGIGRMLVRSAQRDAQLAVGIRDGRQQ